MPAEPKPYSDIGGGGPNPPHGEDFFDRIVNVHWPEVSGVGDTLAVEIDKGGGLDLRTNVPGLGKAVISFWFRFPAYALGIIAAEWNRYSNDETGSIPYTPLLGIIPLLTWGKTGIHATEVQSTTGPSYIGISMNPDVPTDAHLVLRFTGLEHGTVTNTDFGVTFFSGSNYYAIGSIAAEDHYGGVDHVTDNMKVDPDTWHHLLMSFDVSGPSGTMYIAIDDHNYTATTGGWYPAAPAMMDGFGFSGGPQEILSVFSYPIYNSAQGLSSSGAGFTMIEEPFGPPTPVEYASYSKNEVQLAELQVFTGFTVDTGDINIRRLFLDEEKGVQVGKLIPVHPKRAEDYFRKKPVVLLHGTHNWQGGKNTGSLGVTGNLDEKAAGQFDTRGAITKYVPDPSI